jgi:spore coat polysaccharide biosynthesis predicted glycosyltransferase SpsG
MAFFDGNLFNSIPNQLQYTGTIFSTRPANNNIIFRVLDALSQFEDVIIKIITSNASGYYQELINFCDLHSINAEIKLDIDSLAGEWSDVDFAITAGGNVLFERIASGVPGVTVCQLPRQMEIAEFFSDNGVNINLGYGPSMTAEDLRLKFSLLMESDEWKKKQIELSKVLVPGNGLNRCIEKIIKLGT